MVVGDIPDGIATVLVAIIGAAQAAVIALLARQSSRQKKVERDVREITYQTRNSHTVNLRDDLDKKHEETSGALAGIVGQVKDAAGAIIGIRKDLQQLRDVDLDHGRDLQQMRGTVADVDKKLDQHLEWSRKHFGDLP